MSALDRLAVDEAAPRPEAKAAAILRQLGVIRGPVLVHDIARALDIVEIREERFTGMEGMLLTEPERDIGIIGVNASSARERRRFSIAHELGHFLCDWHRPTGQGGFQCTVTDMILPRGDERHVRQETEANRFAIELLAPADLIKPHLRRVPDLEHVLRIHGALEISRTAAARRYVSLHPRKVATVFAKDGAFRYVERSAEFPYLPFERGEVLPQAPRVHAGEILSEMIEADTEDWRLGSTRSELAFQVLRQENGHAIILLYLEE